MSRQCRLVSRLYNAHKKRIDEIIIKKADDFLASNPPLDKEAERPYSGGDEAEIYYDGIFDPFTSSDIGKTPEAVNYGEYVAENGNEDDEVMLVGAIWMNVLARADYQKYEWLIKTLLDIQVRGM